MERSNMSNILEEYWLKIHKNNAEYILNKKNWKSWLVLTDISIFHGSKSPIGESILKYSFGALFITWTEQSEKLTAQQ